MIHELADYSLLKHNTFGLDVTANRFIEYNSVEDLSELIRNGRVDEPFIHIGGGSNLLFLKDFNGLILHSGIKGTEIVNESSDFVEVKAGAGIDWDEFVAFTVRNGWYGLENLSFIPGEVGASAVQNIGAYGVEAKDYIVYVDAIDVSGKSRRFENPECGYGYRESIFKQPGMKRWFVTHVTFRLSKKPAFILDYGTVKEEVASYPKLTQEAVRQTIISIRKRKLPDPKVAGNAGSFFMNPVVSRDKFVALQHEFPNIHYYEVDDQRVKIPAAWMIDQCGWKGKALGNAAVHDKQPLVLINLGGATGAEIINLSSAIRASVLKKFGIDIHPEVTIIG